MTVEDPVTPHRSDLNVVRGSVNPFGPVVVTRGDAGALHLPDECVDLIVTSPPYFGLRSYTDDGEHYAEQVGAEPTPAEYLDALIACTAEWMRVLKPGGSIFVNLGDKYAGAGRGNNDSAKLNNTPEMMAARLRQSNRRQHLGTDMAPAKSLMLLPQRYAIRCVDDLGLILRAEIVWSKPNGLPESVTDRVRRSHEQVFHFVKQPRYYSAVDEVREPHTWGREVDPKWAEAREATAEKRGGGHRNGKSGGFTNPPNPLGKLPGSVWTIATSPLQVPEHLGVDHFAAYPPELVRRIVAGWSPREVCTACGEGRRPISKRDPIDPAFLASNKRGDDRGHVLERGVSQSSILRIGLQSGQSPATRITGYACACPDAAAPSTPGVVLDPFGGTGTTALVASVLGRVGISVDLSADYCRLAAWRTSDPGERARALQVDKPPTPVEGQLDLFGGAM